MSEAKPTLTLEVDLTNPGQFLACCGVLELASLADIEATGWFSANQFHLSYAQSDLLEALVTCPISRIATDRAYEDVMPAEEKTPPSPPILLGAPFNLRLDWWTDGTAVDAGFKTWSAGMTVLGFLDGGTKGKGEKARRSSGMRQHMTKHLHHLPTLLTAGVDPIDDPMPFNFDSRLSRNNAIDLGFVGKGTFEFSPAVELLALIGLQRFRPKVVDRWQRNIFCTWSAPLPASIAAAVAHGLLPVLTHETYWFPVIPRDAQGRYKLFGFAQLVRSSTHG